MMPQIFKNGKIFASGDKGFLDEDTVIIANDGIITYIGPSDDELAAQALIEGAQIYDMQGQIVAPSFVDGHVHLLQLGASLLKINLEPCKNLDDIREAIKKGAAERPNATRLFGRGYMHFQVDGEPTAAMLDDLDPRPIYINARDLHSTWCNTTALKELNVQNMPDPKGGKIHRDSSGNPSGLMSEVASINLVWPYVNSITTFEEKMTQSRTAIKAHSAHGYTGFVELATDEDVWECMLELHKEGAPIRMAAHWIIAPSDDVQECIVQVDRAIELHKKYNLESSPDCRIAGIKLILDGTIDACTAALNKPYTTDGSNTEPFWKEEHLRAVVAHADAAGLQCALHAIGDRSVTLAINTIEACGTPGRRHRIEHLEVTAPEDAMRLGKLGITASIQPVHSDPAILRAWTKLLGPERRARAFAYSEFHEGGATLSIGTDAPTAPTHPLHNLHIATTRKSVREPETKNLEPVNPQFVLPLPIAFASAAEGTAKSCFAEKRVGTLEVGKCADFVVLKTDWDGDGLLKGEVLETWFSGRRVY